MSLPGVVFIANVIWWLIFALLIKSAGKHLGTYFERKARIALYLVRHVLRENFRGAWARRFCPWRQTGKEGGY